MTGWRVDATESGLRLAPVVRRALGSEELSSAELLYTQLSSAKAFCLYFPSRFDLRVDDAATQALRVFGTRTSADTLVDFWDPTDPEFSRALALFGVNAPPALILMAGLRLKGATITGPDGAQLYSISITDPAVLADPERLAHATNAAYEVVVRGDPGQIAGFLRKRAAVALLEEIGRLSKNARDQLVLLKPKFGLPGGLSVEIG